MTGARRPPAIVRVLRREGRNLRRRPTGEVGLVHRHASFEVVWVRKQGERVDPRWFSSPEVDLLIVVQGRLRVEFAEGPPAPRTLGVGDVLVLPPNVRCRAYRWPRTARRATVFLAVYPRKGRAPHPGRQNRRSSRRGA